MQVVATAGHADHGKSTLVRALTGMEPDRPAEEHEQGQERGRGVTTELGFAWTTLPTGRRLAVVDVPGHERFVTGMLAGVGPVPAVIMVVAADEGWRPQSEEHLAALDAFGVRHGLLVVTRSDLADPAPAMRQAMARIRRSRLGGVETVAVSAATGTGLPELTAALDRLAGRLPAPDPGGPVRLWIDRASTSTGGGTVVTGTLGGGAIRTRDRLLLGERTVTVQAVEMLDQPVDEAVGVTRVALHLRGVDRREVARGMALVTPGGWTRTGCADVRLAFGEATGRLSRQLTLHVGAAAVRVWMRPLGPDTARLVLNTRLPLHAGDRAVLRDPGRRMVAGVSVLDVRPPALNRRGAAAARGRELAGWPDRPGGELMLRRHGLLRPEDLAAMGCDVPAGAVRPDAEWVADPLHWAALGERLREEAARQAADRPQAPGLTLEAARLRLGLPTRRLVTRLVRPPLRMTEGRVHLEEQGPPGPVAAAVPSPRDGLAAIRTAVVPRQAVSLDDAVAALDGRVGRGEGAAEKVAQALREVGTGAVTEAVIGAVTEAMTGAVTEAMTGAVNEAVTAGPGER